MGKLYDLGVVKSKTAKTALIFEQILGDFQKVAASSPHQYVKLCWQKYEQTHPHQDVGTNGKFFELTIATVLIREGIVPFYMQAKIAFVPNIEYDFILYTTDSGPLCLSTKTSLRERYKQADLEAVALKNVHRRAKSYLINISDDENKVLQKKIAAGDMMGLDGSLSAFSSEFDDFVSELKKRSMSIAPQVKVITSETLITGKAAKNATGR